MENTQIATLCRIRDIYRSIANFELDFQKKYGICLNEGMLLCTLGSNKYASNEIANALGLSNSNASKIIKLLETKNLIKRIVGTSDKRKMYFMLSDEGHKRLEFIKCNQLTIPEELKSIIQL